MTDLIVLFVDKYAPRGLFSKDATKLWWELNQWSRNHDFRRNVANYALVASESNSILGPSAATYDDITTWRDSKSGERWKKSFWVCDGWYETINPTAWNFRCQGIIRMFESENVVAVTSAIIGLFIKSPGRSPVGRFPLTGFRSLFLRLRLQFWSKRTNTDFSSGSCEGEKSELLLRFWFLFLALTSIPSVHFHDNDEVTKEVNLAPTRLQFCR